MKIEEIRAKYPMYDDISNEDFAKAFHAKYYSDMEFNDFSKRIGLNPGSPKGRQIPSYTRRLFAERPDMHSDFVPSPTSGMDGGQKFDAGVGKFLFDTGRGIKQIGANVADWVAPSKNLSDLVTGVDNSRSGRVQRAIDDARELDEPLMQTGAGRAGNIVGGAAFAAPTMFIPGANTLTGAALIGGGLGATQPVATGESRLKNTVIGGVASPAGMLAGRGIVAAGNGVKAALIDPFTKAGQQRIAERTFQSMAGGADEAAQAAQSIRSAQAGVLPGVQPTTAELAQNPGLANLERLLKNNPEFTTAFGNRAMGNRNAMLSAVDDIAGDDAGRQAAVAARKATSDPLYSAADIASVNPDKELDALLRRPSMGQAWKQAARLAAEEGRELTEGALSGETLHYLKMAMDDMANWAPGSAIGKTEAAAIGRTRDRLLAWMDEKIPAYGAARAAFREGSRPINQMDVGSALRDKLTPALTDFGAQTRLRPESFAQAMRHGDATAASVLGRSNASLSDVMTPHQMSTLRKVGEQLARRVNADELGRAVGSNTGQNLVGQNVMRQFLGPLGLPDSWIGRMASSPVAQGITGAPSALAQAVTRTAGEPNILKRLVEIGMSPEDALKVLEAQIKQNVIPRLQWIAPAVSGANASSQ